jgi:hypothetical protein
MKNFLLAALLLATTVAVAQSSSNNQGELIEFKVRNNSWWPHKFTLIGYNYGESYNWTNGIWLPPGATKKYTCPVGTKIYLASRQQVGIVMGGGSIRNDDPLILVGAGDTGRVFPLRAK